MRSRAFGLLIVLLTLFITASSSSSAAAAEAPTAGFSVKDVRGGYGFSIFGLAASAAAAGAGVFTADGNGKITAHFSLALTEGGRQIIMAQQDAVDVANGVAFKQ